MIIQENKLVDGRILFPELRVIAPELPDDMLLHYIRHSAIEFATRSQLVVQEHCIDIQPCVAEYDLHLTDQERFISFQDKTVNDGCPSMSACSDKSSCEETECNGYVITWSAPRQRLMLSPEPSRASKLCLKIAVAPSLIACEFDPRLINDNYKGILYGALTALHAVPPTRTKKKKVCKNRFDISLVPYYEHKFQREITAAGIDRLLNQKRGLVKMRKPRIM